MKVTRGPIAISFDGTTPDIVITFQGDSTITVSQGTSSLDIPMNEFGNFADFLFDLADQMDAQADT